MIAVDVEATGTEPALHSILAIGAVDTEEPSNQFYDECRAFDGARIEEEALLVNGFSREEATDPNKKTEAELLRAFFAWATDRPKNRTLIAQNVAFDYGCLLSAAKRAGEAFPFAKRTLDLHSLAWLHMESHGVPQPVGDRHSLINMGFTLRYCGLPEEPKPHNALTGALCHAELFSRIAYNEKLLTEFSSFDIPWLQ